MDINRLKTRSKILTVLWITLAWMLIGVFWGFYEAIVFDYELDRYYFNYPEDHPYLEFAYDNALGPFIGGILGGYLIVFYFREKFRLKSYGFKVLVESAIYIGIVWVIVIVVVVINTSKDWDLGVFHPRIIERVIEVMSGIGMLKLLITWYSVIVVTLLILEINDKYGRGVFLKFILGEYYHPKRETRIFMFLDIRSSTAIAEKLGHKMFFLLLKDFFNDVTDPIIIRKGNIYQYVGDELVVSWTLKNGLTHNNCIQCFFDIGKEMQRQKEKYTEKYDLIPEFKAGMHVGEVTTGEIGIIKKDLVHTGDTLNTASRIQEQCNNYGHNLLISHELRDLLTPSHSYTFTELGTLELKGRKKKVGLSAVTV
jgi:adenylate cyclase